MDDRFWDRSETVVCRTVGCTSIFHRIPGVRRFWPHVCGWYVNWLEKKNLGFWRN